uniref:Uncharacterized protein n=1 Tax=Phaseolus vulgaris TaxID=3885 RepID=V7C4D3_PHAVU|nr:hypothetical protein PHAVU_003G002400g [Phaseolus vulgaris]ESW25037.1 hypothetical protein PHAVU_003G002400g [Phaseolus vulgaris]
MECLLGFASSVSRDLVCGALNQLRYPCCFNNFLKKLEEEEGDLIVTRDSVQKFVTNAKKQTRKTSEVVDKWLQDAINDVDNVNQLLKEAKAKRICCFGHCPNWIWQYRVGKKLANKNVYLEKFIAEGRKYVPFDRIATLPSGTLDILSEKCMNFESRQSAYEKLLEAVKNNDVDMIGLYGMGGCGKTTLAMEVMKLVEAEHFFEKVLFVPISSTVEVRRIQEKIASSLQYTFPETEVMERAQRLCLRLNQEKKILVILDDVWEKLDFGGIGIPSSEHHKGCKILITTRSEEVCTSMDCQRKIYLPILTDEEAWTLFQNKALIFEDTPDTLKNLGRLISNECKGLPVAIAAVASSLKGKAETIWSVALNKLRSSKPINIERGLIDPYKCLQLSYDNLDNKEAKSLFLLCSVFPEDYEIPLEILTRYAIGLGVVGEAHSYEEARSEVVAAKIKLVSSCLLLDEKDEYVKMHDIVRDVAHLIAKNENKIIKCEEEKDVTIEQNSVRYLCLSLNGCSLSSFDVAITQVTTLKLLHVYKCEMKGKNFEVIKRTPLLEELYIVDIEGKWTANSEDYIEFFNTFGVPLTLQRYSIVLGSDNFYDYSYFQYRPRTLLLNHFQISNEVIKGLAKKATNLFVANIQVGAKNIIPDIFQIEGGGLDELSEFEIRNSEEIECLIDTSNQSSTVVTHFSKLYNLRVEKMKNLRALWYCFQPINGPFENLEKLNLSDCPQLTSIFTYIVARSLVQLKILKISRCDELKHILADDDKTEKSQGEFTTEHPVQIFQNLQEVKVNSCRKLKHIFSANIVRGLTQLKMLKIQECDMLDQIIGNIVPSVDQNKKEELDEIIEEGKHPHLYSTSIPSTTIVNNSPGSLSSLASLRINDCPKLGSIFTASTAKTLTSLEELIIKKCNSLKHIITHERVNQNQKEKNFEDDHDFHIDISIFQSLKKLRICGCDLLQRIFPISFVGGMMKEVVDLKDFSRQNNFKENSCHQQQNNTQIELPTLEVLELDHTLGSTVLDNYLIRCPSVGELSLAIGRRVEFFTINCSANGSKARHEDYIAIKILNSDFVPPVESVEYLSKQPQGLTLLIMHNIRDIELKGFDKVKYLFKSSIASSLMLESLTIRQCDGLEHIIDIEDEYGKESLNAIFPNLRYLSVSDCGQLKYMLGQYPVANQDCEEIHIHFSALEILYLYNLPNFVSICATNNLTMTWPSLKEFYSDSCLTVPTDSREHFSISKKDPKGIQNHFFTLQYVTIRNSEVKASELEELVGCGQGKSEEIRKSKVELPRLKLLIFMHLSNFCQETELPNIKNCVVYECPKLSLTPTTTLGELKENFPYKDLRNTRVYRWEIEVMMSNLDEDSASSEFTSLHEIGEVGNENIEEGSTAEGDKTKSLSTDVEDISIGSGVAIHIQSGDVDILEQDDKMNDGKAGIMPSQEIQVEEGLNLLDKQEEIHIVSNNNIDISPASADIRTRLGMYKHFVDLDDAQIALLVEAITTYPHLWNACEKFSDRFQAWRLKILADILLFLQKESVDNVTPQREKEFHKLCEEAVEIGFESSLIDEMRQHVLTRDPKLREDIAERQMDENPKRFNSVDMVLDSQVVKQGDESNENCKRSSRCVKTQNVNNSFEESSNLVDKEGEIGVVSIDRIAARNEEPEKEFVAEVSTPEIPRTTTSLTNSQPSERPTPSYLNIPLRETLSNALVDKQRISEPCLMNRQKSLGKIVSSSKIPQSIEREAVEKTIEKNTSITTSSIHSESTSSQFDQIFTSQTKSHTHSEIRSSRTETHTVKESGGHPKIIQDSGANDIMSLFAPVVVGKESEDNIVGKIFVELEKYLKMSLKDIVSSETNSINLLSALNFLSNLPFKDVSLSDGLKDIIGTMQQEFPSIVCSFKQGFATTDKLAELEARGNEVATTLGSKIFEAKNFYDEAQLKEVVLKEQIIRLKEEIKVCEDALSSLEEEKNKRIAETIGYKMELENVRKDQSQMVEDERKVQQKLFEVTYKWSVMCSQYEYNRMVARNSS